MIINNYTQPQQTKYQPAFTQLKYINRPAKGVTDKFASWDIPLENRTEYLIRRYIINNFKNFKAKRLKKTSLTFINPENNAKLIVTKRKDKSKTYTLINNSGIFQMTNSDKDHSTIQKMHNVMDYMLKQKLNKKKHILETPFRFWSNKQVKVAEDKTTERNNPMYVVKKVSLWFAKKKGTTINQSSITVKKPISKENAKLVFLEIRDIFDTHSLKFKETKQKGPTGSTLYSAKVDDRTEIITQKNATFIALKKDGVIYMTNYNNFKDFKEFRFWQKTFAQWQKMIKKQT